MLSLVSLTTLPPALLLLLVAVIGWTVWLSLRMLDLWSWSQELKRWKTVRQPRWERAKYLLGFS